jgi:hypothetical protein
MRPARIELRYRAESHRLDAIVRDIGLRDQIDGLAMNGRQ